METSAAEGKVAFAGRHEPGPVFIVGDIPSLRDGGHHPLTAADRLSEHIHAVLRIRGPGDLADHIALFHVMDQVHIFEINASVLFGGIFQLYLPREKSLIFPLLPSLQAFPGQ